jgi:chromosome segregation ATPase
LREFGKRQKELESEIEHTEERMQVITTALADEETYKNGSAGELSKEYDDHSSKLSNLYSEWEKVCEQLREVEAEVAEGNCL